MQPDEAENLSEAFWGIARALRHRSKATLEPWDLSPSHSRALRVIEHHNGMRLSELAEHLRIAARSATEVVDALEGRGLVARQPDPHDRRATLVALTDAGRAIGTAIRQARVAEAEGVFANLSPTERGQLGALLRKLRAAID